MSLKQVSDVFGEIGLAQLDVKFLAKVVDLVMMIINVGKKIIFFEENSYVGITKYNNEYLCAFNFQVQ